MSRRGRPPIYKLCPDCRRRKLIAEDYYTWAEDGGVRVAARCKPCYRARVRKYYAKQMADPYTAERVRERQNRWAQRKARNPERCKRYREKLKIERPEVYQQQLEDARIRNRLRNERLGKPAAAKRAVVVEPEIAALPLGPLVSFLNCVDIASIDKATARLAYRALNENRSYVTVNVADRLVTAYGGAFSNVYPELFA
jgi:hypothetical protein